VRHNYPKGLSMRRICRIYEEQVKIINEHVGRG
jgi:hypothetical protein